MIVLTIVRPAQVAAQITPSGSAGSDSSLSISHICSFIPMASVEAGSANQRECPVQVGDGVLCTGPTPLTQPIDSKDSRVLSMIE